MVNTVQRVVSRRSSVFRLQPKTEDRRLTTKKKEHTAMQRLQGRSTRVRAGARHQRVSTKPGQKGESMTEWAITAVDVQMVGQTLLESVGAGGLTPFDLDRILVPAGGGLSWTIPTPRGEQTVQKFEAVILYHHEGRSYWPLPFGEVEKQPPSCTSMDGITGEGDPGGECHRCAFAQFGSKIVQGKPGKGQACKQQYMLYLLLPESILPVLLIVPPSSLGHKDRDGLWRYLTLGAASLGYRVRDCVTELSLVREKNADGIVYSRIAARFAGALPEATRQITGSYSQGFRALVENKRRQLLPMPILTEAESPMGWQNHE